MPGPVVAAAYTPPGAAFLATEPGKLALWQLGGHAEKISSRDLGIGVTCLAMSEVSGVDGIDGATRTLAAACDDGVIRVFRADDLSDLELITVPGFIRDIDVSAERLVAALSHDRRIRAWDLVTQAAVCESVAGTGASRLAIDPRGDEVLVLTDAGPGRFPLSATALAAWARRAAGRELTVAERRHYLDDPAI
jgi:WD40 repeat protein